MNTDKIFENIRKNPNFFIDSLEEVVNIIKSVIDSCESDDQEFVKNYEDLCLQFNEDFNAISDGDCCEDCSEQDCDCCDDEYDNRLRFFVSDDDILVEPCGENEMPVYGEYGEVTDAMPDELKSIITFENHGVKFGKFTKFNSIQEFMFNVNSLSKRIRPSRGSLTAPGFRNLVEIWRTNMIEEAKLKNGITLNI